MQYRPDIDGLRAIAVIAVLLYHAHIPFFQGGYVGVDVFFVISGFLISKLIYQERSKGKFSFVLFYERRARRILPPLFLVMIFCIPLAWRLMLPAEYEQFSNSLVATSLFSSNLLFWRESGYFDGAAELKPLLHTWSLAIEEQYYIFFPAIFIGLLKFGKKFAFFVVFIGFLLSFSLGVFLSEIKPTASFYLLPTRAWELLLGVLLALATINAKFGGRYPLWLKKNLGVIGIVLIVFSIVSFDAQTVMPGFATLLPTLGAALIIGFPIEKSLLFRFLSSKYMVALGLVSYGWYLWHQPLFAFARISSVYEPSPYAYALLMLISLVLAMISYRYIENPIRRDVKGGNKIFFWTSIGLISASLIAVGLVGKSVREVDSGFRDLITWDSLGHRLSAEIEPCTEEMGLDQTSYSLCVFGALDSDKTLAFIGDSHYQAISFALQDFSLFEGFKIISVKTNNCGMIPTLALTPVNQDTIKECKTDWLRVEKVLAETADSIFFINRWTFKLYPIPDHIEMLNYVNSYGIVEKSNGYRESVVVMDNGTASNTKASKIAAMEEFFLSLTRFEIPIYLLTPIPEMGWDIARANYLHFLETGDRLPELSISKKEYLDRNALILEFFDTIDSKSKLINTLPVHEIFCSGGDGSKCYAQNSESVFYLDDDHLSETGAAKIVQVIQKILFSEGLK